MATTSWSDLHSRLHQLLKEKSLLPAHTRVLIGVSGGQDSLCLLKLLLDLQTQWQWHLAIAHCDHQWATDRGIADHVKKIAQDFQLPFYLKIAPPLKETEAIARQWRYQALMEIAQTEGFDTIVTGHTLSDRAETFLYNLIRGAGTDGLQALTWQRVLTPQIKLIRPLLGIKRSETGEFCRQFRLPIWDDVANHNPRYTRNRIRSQLIPCLEEYNPQVEKHLAQTAEILQSEVDFLEKITQDHLQQIVDLTKTKINRYQLSQLDLAIQRRIIRCFLKENLNSMPDFEQIEGVRRLINAPNQSRTSTLANKMIIEVKGDWLELQNLCAHQFARDGLDD